jgi:hypothetical protein
LPPKSRFIAVESLEHAAFEIGKAQEAMGQFANSAGMIGAGMIEAVRLMFLYSSFAAIRP